MSFRTYRIPAIVLMCVACIGYADAQKHHTKTAVTFLTKVQARKAIVDDSLEPYFDQLQPMEMSAKTGTPIIGATIEQKRTQCRQRYQKGVLAFSKPQQDAIQWCIDKLTPVLVESYPLIGNMAWSFIKVSDNIEGGLPHTRGKHIVLSESLCRQLETIKDLPPERMAHLGILQLLAHEQFHVFQRTHPGFCDSLYTDLWGFEKAETITGCNWLTKHHLANPDAVACQWILPVKQANATTYLWPLAVFAEGDRVKTMPFDFRMIAISVTKQKKTFTVKLTEDNKPVFTDLQQTPAFRALFPLTSDIYHPDEASADMFGTLILFDSFIPEGTLPLPKKNAMERQLAPLRKWLINNCKNPTKTSSN